MAGAHHGGPQDRLYVAGLLERREVVERGEQLVVGRGAGMVVWSPAAGRVTLTPPRGRGEHDGLHGQRAQGDGDGDPQVEPNDDHHEHQGQSPQHGTWAGCAR